jgi:hypothetical protein
MSELTTVNILSMAIISLLKERGLKRFELSNKDQVALDGSSMTISAGPEGIMISLVDEPLLDLPAKVRGS